MNRKIGNNTYSDMHGKAKSDFIFNGMKLTSVDTCLSGCFYHSIFNCIDLKYRQLDNDIDRMTYIQEEKLKLIEVLKNNFDTLGNGFFSEVGEESYSFDTIKAEILGNVIVGYELLPLFELYFDINIYVIDLTTFKPINLCKINKEGKDCIALGYSNLHFVSVSIREGEKYITNFSYDSCIVSMLK